MQAQLDTDMLQTVREMRHQKKELEELHEFVEGAHEVFIHEQFEGMFWCQVLWVSSMCIRAVCKGRREGSWLKGEIAPKLICANCDRHAHVAGHSFTMKQDRIKDCIASATQMKALLY